MTGDRDLLPPSIDPATRKMSLRNVRGVNRANSRTEVAIRQFTLVTDEPVVHGGSDSAPTPLETLLGSLVGCEAVIIHRCAKAMRFAYSGVDIEAGSEIDLRGLSGVSGIRQYFESVRLAIRLHSPETPERLAKLAKNVENRCPVMTLLRAAGVEVAIDWGVVDPSSGPGSPERVTEK